MSAVSEWRAQVSVVSRVVIVVVDNALAQLPAERNKVRLPLLAVRRDAHELQEMDSVGEFAPSEQWSRCWANDINANAAAISRLVSIMGETEDPIMDIVSPVTVAVARLVAIVVGVPRGAVMKPDP